MVSWRDSSHTDLNFGKHLGSQVLRHRPVISVIQEAETGGSPKFKAGLDYNEFNASQTKLVKIMSQKRKVTWWEGLISMQETLGLTLSTGGNSGKESGIGLP